MEIVLVCWRKLGLEHDDDDVYHFICYSVVAFLFVHKGTSIIRYALFTILLQLGVIQSISNNSNISNIDILILIMIINILSSYIIIMIYRLLYENWYSLPTGWALSIFYCHILLSSFPAYAYLHLFIFIFANCQLPFSYSQVPHFIIQIQAKPVFIVCLFCSFLIPLLIA